MTGLLRVIRQLALCAPPLAVLLFFFGAGCSTETTRIPGDPCKGGFFREETGECEPLCDESQCKPGNRCVDNRCSLLCETQQDCPDKPVCDDQGNCLVVSQECTQTVVDGPEPIPVRACLPVSARVSPVAPGYKCPLGWECFQHYCPFDQNGVAQKCDPFACGGNPANCVNGVCAGTTDPCVGMPCNPLECKASLFCPNGMQCDPLACGGAPQNCQPDCPGDEPCNVGKCAGTGEACIYTDQETCPFTACKPMTCLTVGEGDANAYCATVDCALPSQSQEPPDPAAPAPETCAPGFYCGNIRDPHDLCGPTCAGGTCNGGPFAGSSCGTDSDCQKGNDATCGETLEECISPEQVNTQFGATYFEGPRCLMRTACLKRDTCAPCENNIDCSVGDGDVCVNLYEDLVCVRFCAEDTDCYPDHMCVPFTGLSGNNSTCADAPTIECASAADCPSGECIERKVCIPRAGECRADPAAAPEQRFCRHCVDDTDCGSAETNSWACVEVTSGERACFDTSLPWTCTVDSDCPTAPEGDFGECLDEGEGVSPGNSAYHKCYFPFSAANMRFTCFP